VSGARIRSAGRGDAAAIARIHIETWRSAYAGMLPDRVLVDMSRAVQQRSWARQIAAQIAGDDTVMVALDSEYGAEGGVIGFGSCGPNRDRRFAYAGEVYTLYVLPDFQGRGHGRALLAALFGALRGRSLNSALIWVLADNPSRFFYEAMGGARSAVRIERLWGTALREAAYGWRDLARFADASRAAAWRGAAPYYRNGDEDR